MSQSMKKGAIYGLMVFHHHGTTIFTQEEGKMSKEEKWMMFVETRSTRYFQLYKSNFNKSRIIATERITVWQQCPLHTFWFVRLKKMVSWGGQTTCQMNSTLSIDHISATLMPCVQRRNTRRSPSHLSGRRRRRRRQQEQTDTICSSDGIPYLT